MLSTTVSSSSDRTRVVPSLDAFVPVEAGVYRLGDEGDRVVALERVLIGRWPLVTEHFRAFVEATSRPVSRALGRRLEAEQLADHPVTEVSFADAVGITLLLDRLRDLDQPEPLQALDRLIQARPRTDVDDPVLALGLE